MRRRVILHPFCFGVFPVLSLLAANINEVRVDRVVVTTTLASLLGAAVVFALLRLVLRDWQRAGLAASAWVLSFFSYSSVTRGIAQGVPAALQPALEKALLPAIWLLLLLAVTVALFRTRRDLTAATRVANVTALFLVALPLLQIGKMTVARARYWQAFSATPLGSHAARTLGMTRPPDVYYIILDRYGSARNLQDLFGYDNTPFLDYLKAKGFYVASESYSNYPRTHLSLASSLNLEYLDDLSRLAGKECTDWAPAASRLQNHVAGRLFRSHGFQIVHMGSWFADTMMDGTADLNLNATANIAGQFGSALLGTAAVLPRGVRAAASDPLYRAWAGTQRQFDMLADVPPSPKPRFIFAHVLLPHEPYVFDRHGKFVPPDVARSRPVRENYLEQLRYANERLKQLVDTLLAQKPNPPVILLQADEGPFPARYENDGTLGWRHATDAELRTKSGILNAYYLPGPGPTGLYPSITPVNSLRLVSNRYLKAGLPMLPDRCYGIRDGKHPYDFFEITERLRPPAAQGGAGQPNP